MMQVIIKAAEEIIKANKIVALTGAGISAESGIPTFRDKGGIWEKYDPNEYGDIEAFKKNPGKVWKMLKEFINTMEAKPNPGHLGLAKLERMGYLSCIITQNADNLHQEAGNTYVLEFHGNMKWLVCMSCNKRYKASEVSLKKLPPLCNCGGVLKPDAVFFGEPIPPLLLQKAQQESQICDVMLVIGTSGVVYPAAGLPIIARQSGGKVIEINPERTPLTDSVTDYFIQGTAGEIVPLLVQEVKNISCRKPPAGTENL